MSVQDLTLAAASTPCICMFIGERKGEPVRYYAQGVLAGIGEPFATLADAVAVAPQGVIVFKDSR